MCSKEQVFLSLENKESKDDTSQDFSFEDAINYLCKIGQHQASSKDSIHSCIYYYKETNQMRAVGAGTTVVHQLFYMPDTGLTQALYSYA